MAINEDLNLNPLPCRRGPMYPVYSQLREWRLLSKKLRSQPSPSSSPMPPTPSRKPAASSTFRPSTASSGSTPLHASPNHVLKKVSSVGSTKAFSVRSGYDFCRKIKQFSGGGHGEKKVPSLKKNDVNCRSRRNDSASMSFSMC